MDFLHENVDIGQALDGRHDLSLVALSYLVAVLGSYAGLAVAERLTATKATSPITFGCWVAAGAVAMGCGVWSMHFVGMLAYHVRVDISYDPVLTVVSALPAILASAVALLVLSKAFNWRRVGFGGLAVGLGIGAMHYTGMAAAMDSIAVYYDPVLFWMSVVVAVVLAIIALGVKFLGTRGDSRTGLTRTLISAPIMGAAIAGMHYTAMASAYCFGTPTHFGTGVHLESQLLAAVIAMAATMIAALAIVASIVNRRLEDAAQQVSVSRTRMLEAIESFSDGFVLFDAEHRFVMCNTVFREMHPELTSLLISGTPHQSFLRGYAGTLKSRFDGADPAAFVETYIGAAPPGGDTREEKLEDGRWMYVREKRTGTGGLVGLWTEITELKELQDRLNQLAHHDPLTGLPNRALFHDRLNMATQRAKRYGHEVAFLYIDLDGFKPINDTIGHEAGDIVLTEVASRLKACVRGSDTAARLGGDEFAIILDPVAGREVAARVAERVLASLAEPIAANGQEAHVGASIGIALFPEDSDVVTTLIKLADAAMYRVKEKGRNSFLFHGA